MPRHFRWLGKELEARCDPMGFRTTDTNSFTSSLDRSSSQALVSGCGSKSITWYLSSFLLSHTWNFNCYLIKHYYKGHKGYDVAAIACPEHHIVGLDISDVAIKKAVELSSSLPNASCFNFLMADFFTWSPIELFDLILNYTFFCAIEPDMRLAWAQRIRDILKPGGELITLMFPGFCEIVDLPVVGQPFLSSRAVHCGLQVLGASSHQ
ncbi:hypothetical protein RGQ29_032276 [Quercus rubra]|uniref:S-adenosylmethionine-dependent methyltransferase n=1 Tax=Quercus rubra TaxID=3512 RepID=A0AAN7DVQ0_QUERU|nr:hypothetical protein RGQ29_032276 [Quercus rubra]